VFPQPGHETDNMLKPQNASLNSEGIVLKISDEAALACGIPPMDMVGYPLIKHLIPEHRTRFTCELEAIVDGLEQHGRVHCVMMGADHIGRRLVIQMNQGRDRLIDLFFSTYKQAEPHRNLSHLSFLHAGRLLPVARRILAISRRASSKDELISDGLKVLAEATSAEAGAALDWENIRGEDPIVTIGNFNTSHLDGIYRAAIMARLTRGDVVVKETSLDGSDSGACLLMLPLLASTSPIGVLVLQIDRDTELVPEEQQSLIILGEIMGLGAKAISTVPRRPRAQIQAGGDLEATSALGRLSAGLSHGINNAATVLRSTIEQFLSQGEGMAHISEVAIRDSMTALDAIQDLTTALRAFSPEETSLFEKADLLRILDTVDRSVSFYAKRGINIEFERPEEEVPLVRVRSHQLTRVLFLIFVELFEASVESGIELGVRVFLKRSGGYLKLTTVVSAGPFGLPTVLLSQLEKGGALASQVSEAGGTLSHNVDHQGNLAMTISLMEAAGIAGTKTPSSIAASPHRRGTILIADEEVAVIRSLRRVLDQYYDIFAARSGEEALEVLRSNPHIEVVLYDVSMPRLGGIEFYNAVKSTNEPYADRIIFVKAGSYDTDVTEFLARIKNPVVDKPFDIPDLNDLVASMLM
jgi:CheY-like chemotaxis protein